MSETKRKPGRPKASRDLANFIRASARRAMEESEEEGISLASLLKQEMRSKPLEFIKAVSAYTPKELEISDERDFSELSEAELDDRIARLGAAIEAQLGQSAASESGAGSPQGGPQEPSSLH